MEASLYQDDFKIRLVIFMCASFKPNLGVFKLDRRCELDIIPRKKTATMGPLNERTSDFFSVAS